MDGKAVALSLVNVKTHATKQIRLLPHLEYVPGETKYPTVFGLSPQVMVAATVPGSPADKAGIKAGDRICAWAIGWCRIGPGDGGSSAGRAEMRWISMCARIPSGSDVAELPSLSDHLRRPGRQADCRHLESRPLEAGFIATRAQAGRS